MDTLTVTEGSSLSNTVYRIIILHYTWLFPLQTGEILEGCFPAPRSKIAASKCMTACSERQEREKPTVAKKVHVEY